MGSFLGISLWVALATVVPGLITIGTLYLSFIFIHPQLLTVFELKSKNDWITAGIAISIMVLTQAVGFLQENLFIKYKVFGPDEEDIIIPKGIDPLGRKKFKLRRYDEYSGLYLLIVELKEEDDAQGHLKRILAQFFLTNNTIVSFVIALLLSLNLAIINLDVFLSFRFYVHIMILLLAIIISFKVAKIRFTIMTKSLWAMRRKKMKSLKKNN